MPGEQNNERFKRDVTQGSRLQYLTRMKHFYESQFDELSKKIGEETEYGVLVTEQLLIKIEENLILPTYHLILATGMFYLLGKNMC